ncbi:hypothetical protein L596_014197 [Steinernema carpocapsae]|uniref:Uncharacterized protein n=1 Tax=Steinernema carpocapsae TaxID=34508 RepID=A0A4U5NB52_STECR|nr:hypothetical protein L596_014197 [Steinernema carpocapsae]
MQIRLDARSSRSSLVRPRRNPFGGRPRSGLISVILKTDGSPTHGRISAACKETWPLNCKVTSISEQGVVDLRGNSDSTQVLNITVLGTFLGISELLLECDGSPLEYPEYVIRVIRSDHEASMMSAFNTLAGIFIVFINFLLGTQLEVEKIKSIIKFPIGPLTSICVQFFVMPLFGFALAKLVIPDHERALQLSLFAAACSPGGGKSSFWTIIFDGNLDYPSQ